MTSQIATAIEEILNPRGVAVMLEAEHMCMSVRGVEKPGSSTITTQFTGSFRDNPDDQVRFITMVRGSRALSGCLDQPIHVFSRRAARPRRSRKAAHSRPSSMPTGSSPASRPMPLRRGADGRAHERRGAAQDHRDRRGLVFQPLAPGAVEKRRDLRPRPARGRDARRLRPGCGLDQGRAGRARAPAIPAAVRASTARCRSARPGALTLEFREADKTFDPAQVYGAEARSAPLARFSDGQGGFHLRIDPIYGGRRG